MVSSIEHVIPDGIGGENASVIDTRAFEVAQVALQRLGREAEPVLLSQHGSETRVYTDQGEEPEVAIRLESTRPSIDVLKETRRAVNMLTRLRMCDSQGQHAPVQTFLADPYEHEGFVITSSKFLPGKPGSHYSYGRALASLHNISEARQEVTTTALAFRPLIGTRQTYDYLATRTDIMGDQAAEFMETVFRPRLLEGEALTDEIMDLHVRKGYLPVVMQHDVTMTNVLRDRNGQMTIIDMLEAMQGPAEYTLGRPLGQWTPHFGRPESWAADILKGYEEGIQRPIDPLILRHALRLSKIVYATTPFIHASRSIMRGYPLSEWEQQEGFRRLKFLDVDMRWLPMVS